jgi:hypothetical protein
MLITDKDGKVREHHGTLPDGSKLKVPLTMMDSVQRNIGGTPLVVDAHGNSDLYALRRPGARYPTQRTTADVMRVVAYDEARDADEAAWSKPNGAYPPSAGVGTACTIDGKPGTLQPQGDWLVCRPTEANSGRSDSASHDAKPMTMDEREALYRQVEQRDNNAWRNNK